MKFLFDPVFGVIITVSDVDSSGSLGSFPGTKFPGVDGTSPPPFGFSSFIISVSLFNDISPAVVNIFETFNVVSLASDGFNGVFKFSVYNIVFSSIVDSSSLYTISATKSCNSSTVFTSHPGFASESYPQSLSK